MTEFRAPPPPLRLAAVTGASGMIGSRLCHTINSSPDWGPAIRLSRNRPLDDAHWRMAPDLSDTADWEPVLKGANIVIHCAARAHILKEKIPEDDVNEAFLATNHRGSLQVARAAIAIGASHFVFISSAGVVAGDAGHGPALEKPKYSSLSSYAFAKQRAEEDLIALFDNCACKLIVLRPPLVIAQGAPGNVGLLERMASSLYVDPFAGILNRRSIITCTNLAAASLAACNLQGSETEIFHTVEPATVTTSTLIQAIRIAKKKPSKQLHLPAKLWSHFFTIIGRPGLHEKIFGDFLLDDTSARNRLGRYHQNTLVEELELNWRTK